MPTSVVVDVWVDLVGLGQPFAGLGAYLTGIALVLLRLALELLGGDPGLLGLGARGRCVGFSAAGLDAADLGFLAELACAVTVALDRLRRGPGCAS